MNRIINSGRLDEKKDKGELDMLPPKVVLLFLVSTLRRAYQMSLLTVA